MAVNVNNYTWTQLTSNSGFSGDGVHAAYFNSVGHKCWGGWTGGTNSVNQQMSSSDGATWNVESNASWTGRHTCAYVKDGNTVYMVNGDVFNAGNDGSLAKGSYSFNGTSWTTITTDNGLSGYSLGQLIKFGGNFYFINGQLNTSRSSRRYETWVSEDGCETFTYLADTPADFGNVGGQICVFNGKVWKVGGGLYDDSLQNRSYPRRIYSTTDMINWTVEGYLPYGMKSRVYSQLIVFDSIMWMIGGFHGFGDKINLSEVWASDDGVTWTSQSVAWTGRHAATAWLGPDGIYMGWGTSDPFSNTRQADVWKMTKNA